MLVALAAEVTTWSGVSEVSGAFSVVVAGLEKIERIGFAVLLAGRVPVPRSVRAAVHLVLLVFLGSGILMVLVLVRFWIATFFSLAMRSVAPLAPVPCRLSLQPSLTVEVAQQEEEAAAPPRAETHSAESTRFFCNTPTSFPSAYQEAASLLSVFPFRMVDSPGLLQVSFQLGKERSRVAVEQRIAVPETDSSVRGIPIAGLLVEVVMRNAKKTCGVRFALRLLIGLAWN